jgi:predicted PurR-regulated permease PerM
VPGPPDDAPLNRSNGGDHRTLVGLLVVSGLALGWILLPFFGPILWGFVIALLFSPLNHRLLPSVGGRRSVTALITLLVVMLVVIVPFGVITALLALEASAVYERLQTGEWQPLLYLRGLFDALPDSVRVWLDRLGWGDFDTVQRQATSALARGSQRIANGAMGIGQNTFEFATGVFIALYLAFFLIRDGEALALSARRSLPLTPAHQRRLLHKFGAVIRATVKGNLLVAGIQGLLGGLAFWALGVSAPLLWGVLMAFLSLVPAVGAALVWLPVSVYFVLAGAPWKGVILAGFGVLVIGLVDNILRPVLVGKDTRLPDVVVLITTLGGIVVLGINGFILGPLIAAMFVSLWHLHGDSRAPEWPDDEPLATAQALQASHHQQQEHDHDQHADDAARPVSPTLAVGPGGHDTDQHQDQHDQQDGSEAHGHLQAVNGFGGDAQAPQGDAVHESNQMPPCSGRVDSVCAPENTGRAARPVPAAMTASSPPGADSDRDDQGGPSVSESGPRPAGQAPSAR